VNISALAQWELHSLAHSTDGDTHTHSPASPESSLWLGHFGRVDSRTAALKRHVGRDDLASGFPAVCSHRLEMALSTLHSNMAH